MEQIELRTIDGGSIIIVKARRVHTKEISNRGGVWDDTSFYFVTEDGSELEVDTYDILTFDSFRSEVAAKLFRVLDEPSKERWLQVVARLLVMLQAAPLEEAVKDEREEVPELKKTA